VLAEGLTLSLSDPELGSLVLKKEKPIKTTCPQGVGGLSLGRYTYEGEWIGIDMYLGDAFPMQFPTPPGKYGHDCELTYTFYDADGNFESGGGGDGAQLPFRPPPSQDTDRETSDRRFAHLLGLVDKMSELAKKNYDNHPEWGPELGHIVQMKKAYNQLKKNRDQVPAAAGTNLILYMYKGPAFNLSWTGNHSATYLQEIPSGAGFNYENHGRSWNGENLVQYCVTYAPGYLPYSKEALECSTYWGVFSGQHTCNDDAILQKYYVCTNGGYPSTTAQCCSDSYLNTNAPACPCYSNKSSKTLILPSSERPVALPREGESDPGPPKGIAIPVGDQPAGDADEEEAL
jgi:hypothetical protein